MSDLLNLVKPREVQLKMKAVRDGARTPTRGTEGAAGYDLYSAVKAELVNGCPCKVPTGIAFEIPEGYCMIVYSRSSSASKGLIITPLIVDSDYRGEVFVLVNNQIPDGSTYELKEGDRIAQFMLHTLIDVDMKWVPELSETSRGAGGYGSTGR